MNSSTQTGSSRPCTQIAPLTLGRHQVWPPVVLAPMAGVTNAPFRTMCRRFAPDLIYVNEMVMATAITLMLVASVFAMVQPAQHDADTGLEAADMQQRLRVAMDTLARDLAMAGAGASF